MPDYATLPAREIERLAFSIGPGEWSVQSERPISTLLGSCISLCLYDAALPLAGMNHFMLPQMKQSPHADEDILLAGDACMEALLNAMLQRGGAKHRMRAKIFGGGTVIDAGGSGMLTVGARNTDFAKEWLAREQIPLIAADCLGPWSRKVLFVPATGDAYCKRVTASLVNREFLEREMRAYQAAQRALPNTVGDKKIELF